MGSFRSFARPSGGGGGSDGAGSRTSYSQHNPESLAPEGVFMPPLPTEVLYRHDSCPENFQGIWLLIMIMIFHRHPTTSPMIPTSPTRTRQSMHHNILHFSMNSPTREPSWLLMNVGRKMDWSQIFLGAYDPFSLSLKRASKFTVVLHNYNFSALATIKKISFSGDNIPAMLFHFNYYCLQGSRFLICNHEILLLPLVQSQLLFP